MTALRGRFWARIAVLAFFAAAIVAFLALGGTRYLTLDMAKQHGESLRAFTEAHYARALALAFAVYTIATMLSLPSGRCCRSPSVSCSGAGLRRRWS